MSTPRYSEEIIQQSRKLFGFTVATDPYETYIECGSPRPSRMADQVTRHVITQFEQTRKTAIGQEVRKLLFNGIEDVNTLLDHPLRYLTPSDAEAYIGSQKISHQMALVALRSDSDEMSGIRAVMDMRGDLYRRTVDLANTTNPELHPPTPDSERGCPFAGGAGEVHMDPLFARFIPWAATLSLTALREHRLIQK